MDGWMWLCVQGRGRCGVVGRGWWRSSSIFRERSIISAATYSRLLGVTPPTRADLGTSTSSSSSLSAGSKEMAGP